MALFGVIVWWIGLVTGVLLLLVGLAGRYFFTENQSLLEGEARLMKQSGAAKFPGEPQYMAAFRIGDIEGEVSNNPRRITRFRRIAFWGAGILVVVIAFLFLF